MQGFLLVGIGGAIGAMARYGTSLAVSRFWRDPFPLATLITNVAGAFAMGLLVGWLARVLPPGQNEIRLFVAVGILGGYTTFSTFSLDTITLIERGDLGPAIIYVVGSVVLCIVALSLALMLLRMLPS